MCAFIHKKGKRWRPRKKVARLKYLEMQRELYELEIARRKLEIEWMKFELRKKRAGKEGS